MIIPFNRAYITGKEIDYIRSVIAHGRIIGNGEFTERCHSWIETRLGCPKALLTHSCTAALEMAALLLDIRPGDEIIVPSFTFVSTVNAFVLRGAQPVFIDIRPDTLNLDENQIERLITPRTKAIIPVHYAGVGCEMNSILDISKHYNIAVVEDNAHGFLGKYNGKHLGTMGCLAAQSFHGTKNFTCGEGGALLVNDPQYIERAEIIWEKGTDRNRFYRGEVDRYTWVDLGSSYLPSEMLAAFLYAQLEAWECIQELRRDVWHYYYENLFNWADAKGIRMPVVPEHCEQPYHLFYLLMPSSKQQQELIKHLKDQDILAVFHYLPLHLSRMGRKFGEKDRDCPVTERISACLLRLPFYSGLSEADLARIVEAIYDY